MTDVFFRSAADVAALVRAGRLSARELAEMALDRIEAINPAVHAVVETCRSAALEAAAAADRATARGEPVGALHGVPMTIKEAFQVAGMRSTWGSPLFAGHVAGRDAVVVRRLREAGAVLLGTTNVPPMLADVSQTANEIYGRTLNPWDPTRTPGGSTGGGAASVAAGLAYLEYGSDLAGSIRIPAAFCGVYGLKPSVGTIPLTGFQPPGPPLGASDMAHLSAVGPLARSAGDLRTALRATAGPEEPEAVAYTWRLAPSRHTRLADFRVGVVLDHDRAAVTGEVGRALSDAVDELARAGVTIVPGWPEGVDPIGQARSFGFEVAQFFAFHGGDATFATLPQVVEQHDRRMTARAAWRRYFAEVDVFLCPVTGTAAFPHPGATDGERVHHELAFWIAYASLAGLPAVSAPIGRTPGGLPIGAQIIGPPHEDDTPITFAELATEVLGGYTMPPMAG